jgi:superfamily II DNA or RNA helicase
MQLRTYQQEAINAILDKWKTYDKLLLVQPTGSGKTIVFSQIAKARLGHGRTLILAHREELIKQAQDKLQRSTGIVADREQGEHHAGDAQVIVASIQTMQRRLDKWANKFATVIIDEAHHVLSESYQEVLAAFKGAKILGVTATPDRGDKKNLGSYFEEVAYEIGLLDLIKEKHLSKIFVKSVPLNIDLSNVRTIAGDFNEADLGEALAPYLEAAADSLTEHARGRKVLAFLPLIKTSETFAQMCKARGWKAEHIDGNSNNREQILSRFSSGECNLLCNSMLLTEGYDEPSIDCLMVLRPTRSRALYSQMIGRGTRPMPNKDHLLIIDPLWLTGKLSLIKPAHLIAETDEVADIMSNINNVQEALDLEVMQIDAQKIREESLRKKLIREAGISKYRSKSLIDPISYALDLHNTQLADYSETMKWHSMTATEGQLKALKGFGFDCEKVRNRGHASKLLDLLFTRSNSKLATPKQMNWLRKMGHSSPNTATFTEAKDYLDKVFSKCIPIRA